MPSGLRSDTVFTVKCDRCENEATVHEVMIKGGKKQERHLCEKCARQHGVSIVPGGGGGGAGPPIAQLLSQFMSQPSNATGQSAPGAGSGSSPGATSGSGSNAPASKPITICPSCGLAFAQFRNNGLLGCGACYAAFEGLLSPMLARAHEGGTHHVGRKPRSAIEPVADPKTASGAGVAHRTVPTEQDPAPRPSDSTPAPSNPAQATPGVHATPSSAAKSTKSPRDGASHGEKKSASGSGVARGKSAAGAHDPAKVEAALRQQLKDAIEAEQYEQAASLRDELAKLTGRATGPRADTGSGGHAGHDAGRTGEDHK